jgi:hypothetical protein
MTQQPAAPDAVKVEQRHRDAAYALRNAQGERIMAAIRDKAKGAVLGDDVGDASLDIQAFARFDAEHCRPNLTPAAPDGLVEAVQSAVAAAIAATPTDPALLAENERLKALLGEADCLTINKGRTITIDFADTQAAGKLFAALQSMHLAKLPQS